MLACNPFLEALKCLDDTKSQGVDSENSSRFYSTKGGSGARMEDYLLEKARVTSQSRVIVIITSSTTWFVVRPRVWQKSWTSSSRRGYRYLNHSNEKNATHSPTTIENDADKFRNMCRCLSIADVSEEEQHALWRVLRVF